MEMIIGDVHVHELTAGEYITSMRHTSQVEVHGRDDITSMRHTYHVRYTAAVKREKVRR